MEAEDMNFVDAVIGIPENSVAITVKVTVFENGKLQELEIEYDAEEIREAINLFDETIAGNYPRYELTEKGREMIREYGR